MEFIPAIDSPIVHSPSLKLKARGTRTGGGLRKYDLMVNARNQIVSKKVSEIRKTSQKIRCFKKCQVKFLGYFIKQIRINLFNSYYFFFQFI